MRCVLRPCRKRAFREIIIGNNWGNNRICLNCLMNDSVMPLLTQMNKQVWKWIGQYSQLMVNCLINAEVKMYERALNGIRIGRFMGKWDCKYMELLLSAKPKLTYRNPLNVSVWATVIVWTSPLYCIYVSSGGCTRKVLTCWRHKGHDIRPQRTFLSVLHLRLTMCCHPSNDFMYLSPP